MWRMRLFFGFLVLMAIGHLPQERGVLAQKYYMNFAFNNNNPDRVAGVADEGKANPPNDGIPTGIDNGGNDDPVTDNVNNPGSDTPTNNETGGPVAGGDGGGGGDAALEGAQAPIGDGGGGDGHENGPGRQPTGGNDDDNDDSDSKDAKNRRHKMAEQGRQRTDHSHHSSYEISIDDSFGGRYVRSIYESSESHGHSGSRAGSNPRDSRGRDSSQELKANNEEHGEDNGNPVPGVVDGNVPDGATEGVAARAKAYNDDYEEI